MTTISPALAFPLFAPQRRKTNGLAIMSLTLGILQYLLPSLPTALVTVPFAVNALHQTEQSNQEGRPLAIAGLVLSIAHFAIYVALFMWLLVGH
jgi:Domain of unknown function (DUF4190)